MDRGAHFTSASSLHRDDGDSQSLSQVRPRPAIRLDASFSFLHGGSSRTGSPRSGPASPGLVSQPSALFAPKDMNVGGGKGGGGTTASAKSHSHRTVSGSLQATSISLSLGSSRPPSQHRYGQQQQQQQQQSSTARRRGVFSASAPSHSVSGGGSPSPTAVVDTVLDSEATQMELPSDDSHTRHGALSNVGGERRVFVDDYIAEGLMSRQSSVSAQRATSPAPRMAVTLPDSFQGTFSESCSVLASLPTGAELQRHRRESGEDTTVEGDARGEVDVAGAAATTLAEAQDSGLDLSFFSFRRDEGKGSRDITGERAEDGAEEDAEGSVDCSRTWSRTPPPRRAFVLSRRCSAASITTTHDNNGNEEEEAMAAGEKTEEAPRGSEMLVTRDSDAVGFNAFQLPRAREGEGRNRQQHHHFRQPSPQERTMSEGTSNASVPRSAEAEGVPFSTEEKTAAPSSDAVTTPTQSNDALPAGEDADTSMYPFHPTTGLRLSDYVSGSRRSSMMMSPLPRPVMSATQGSVAAARAALRLSPAHAREDTAEEGEEEEAAKNKKLLSEAPDLSVGEEAVSAPERVEDTAVVIAPCPTSATVSVVEPRSLSPSSSSSSVEARAPETTKASSQPASAVITPTDTEVLPIHTAADAVKKDKENERGEQPATTAAHHAALSSIEASTAVVKADLSSVATPTTSTTALTAVSSLWLVSGSTPTPLRRLRGDHDESTEVTTSAEAGRTTAGAVEQHLMSSLSLPSLPAASALHNTLHEKRGQDIAAGPVEQVGAESCSPEPQRPAESPAAAAAAATGEACVVTVSISPVVHDATEKEPRLHLDVHEANAVPVFTTEPTTAVHTHLRQQQQQQQQQQKRYSFRSSPSVHGTSPPCRAYAADTMSHAPSSPSTTLSESARVSEEVRELVERAQAEVRRTRASLLATLRDRRAEFHLPDLPPVAKTATTDATPATTPTRALVLTDTVTGTDRNGEEAAVVVKSPADVRAARPSGEVRAAALSLRRTLAESADAIHRRLCGYDTKEHGVLPMETVVRVTFFVVTRRHMPAATWTLRTAEGGVATTPLRASMAKKEAMQPPSGWVLSATKGGVGATPRGQRLTIERGATMVSNSASSRKRSRSNPHDDHHNDSGTCSSPSRTLESVMAHQERRAEEEEYLNFYFTVLEAFKQVFGERYAWRHLGATNASRHDSPATRQQRVKVDRLVAATLKGGETPTALTKAAETDVSSPAELDVYNELNEMEGPLETVFPRLRQHYALRQGDGTATTPHAGVSAARPPPLDVLVYYRTFTDSLREL